jgi:hypothetical protein
MQSRMYIPSYKTNMAPALRDFHFEEVYQKKLTESDMKESSRICLQAFGRPSNEGEQTYYKKDDLPFCDAGLKLWPMVFQRRGNKLKSHIEKYRLSQ